VAEPQAADMVKFGYFLIPRSTDPLIETAREVERLGLDYLAIQDHPYQRRFVDTFTLISAILASTNSIKVFSDVACLPLRPPAVLAKTAASLDVLSGGRFELGLGAGAFWEAIDGYGGTLRSPGQALSQLVEGVDVIRRIWSGQRGLRFEGDYYHLRGVHSGPLPAHDIGLWIGASRPRALRQVGRLADGWVTSIRGDMLARLGEMGARVDEGAVQAGRDPALIRRVFNVTGEIFDGPSSGFLRGPATQWAQELAMLVTEHRADILVYGGSMMSTPSMDESVMEQLRRFVAEVVPATRRQLPPSASGE
jgi:alkanesulfonate monooxygenase SsuD/methylene tetrahydromethanopterin reductase-like flavin-dependent oxidoreductase (luciferase family)